MPGIPPESGVCNRHSGQAEREPEFRLGLLTALHVVNRIMRCGPIFPLTMLTLMFPLMSPAVNPSGRAAS